MRKNKKKLVTLHNGEYMPVTKGDCECHYRDSNCSNHLLRCGKPAVNIWFGRRWYLEIINGFGPIYDSMGANVCQDCFDKLVLEPEPSDDIAKYRKIWKESHA